MCKIQHSGYLGWDLVEKREKGVSIIIKFYFSIWIENWYMDFVIFFVPF